MCQPCTVHHDRVTGRSVCIMVDQRPGKDTIAAASRRYGFLTVFLLCQACVNSVFTTLIGHRSQRVIVCVNISKTTYTTTPSTGISMVVAEHYPFIF